MLIKQICHEERRHLQQPTETTTQKLRNFSLTQAHNKFFRKLYLKVFNVAAVAVAKRSYASTVHVDSVVCTMVQQKLNIKPINTIGTRKLSDTDIYIHHT